MSGDTLRGIKAAIPWQSDDTNTVRQRSPISGNISLGWPGTFTGKAASFNLAATLILRSQPPVMCV